MANYSFLQAIPDANLRTLLRQVIDQVNALSGRLDGGVSWRTDVNAGDNRVRNAADAIDPGDLVTLRQLESYLLADVLRQRLEAGGDAELNVGGLGGVLGQPQQMGIVVIPDADPLPSVISAEPYAVITWQGKLYYFSPLGNPGAWVPLSAAASIVAGTHAQRLASYVAASQPLGLLFWETDRTALYRITSTAGVKSWSLVLSRPYSVTFASLPADLGTGDAGFWAVVIDQGQVTTQWTGTAWIYQQGILNAAIASRPAAATTAAGFRFRATDQGYQTWRSTGSAWVLEPGVGGPMRGTVISVDQRPAGLGANDTGFLFFATDCGVTFRWSGAAWALSPTQQPYALRTKNGAQTITTATPTQVTTWTTVVDPVTLVSGDTFVVPANIGGTPSIWRMEAQVQWETGTAGTARLAMIRQNGSAVGITEGPALGTGAATIQQVVATVFNPAAADAFDLAVYHEEGADLDVDAAATRFLIYRLV